MTDIQSQKSLFVASLGNVTVRGLAYNESLLLAHAAKKISRGNIKAMKWLLLIGSLTLGIVNPHKTRSEVEEWVKSNAKDAAQVAVEISGLTEKRPHDQASTRNIIRNG